MKVREAPAELKEMLYGFWISQCLSVVATLGIADCLKSGPKSSDELATLTHCHAPTLYRLLRALTSIGFFREDQHGYFELTPLSELLRTDAQNSIDAEVHHMLHPSNWDSWGQLLHSVRTGEAAFPKVFGKDAWTYRCEHPEIGAIFDRMATTKSRQQQSSLIEHLDFSDIDQIVDVGGGNGALLAEVLQQRPGLSGVLFDQPQVVAGAAEILRAAAVEDRCLIASGNFFQAVPSGGDMYLLKAIIHNWSDEPAIAILKNCRQAMNRSSKLIVIESVLDPAAPGMQNFLDLHMLVIHGGRERTEVEFRMLLEAAGFHLTSITKTNGALSVIEGKPS